MHPLVPRKPHEPSRMLLGGPITVDDVLQALVGQSGRIESNTATQCEIARVLQSGAPADGMAASGAAHDVWKARDAAELAIGREIGVTRCLWELSQVKWLRGQNYSALLTLHRSVPHKAPGELAIDCLRAYYERSFRSQERALAGVYVWSQRVAGSIPTDANELAQSFREGKELAARKKAARLYSDALVVLAEWVEGWNRKTEKVE